ncbi:hypothetical protein DELTA_112 [Brevundimonas phage vB_BsubS-Delta]|nr:hypothetical protein DELTA_112 [Brevundimonas phage vB_BsubS-Delta]
MTDRPILKLANVQLSQLTREAMANEAATERAFVNAIDRARKTGKKLVVRVVYFPSGLPATYEKLKARRRAPR